MEFAGIYDELKAERHEIIAISSDSFDSSRDLKKRLELPFNIYSDVDCAAIKALGIFHEDEPKGRPIARPTIYVLDRDRAIRYRYVGESSRDRPVTAEIPDLVRSL